MIIQDAADPLMEHIKDDPVRPDISPEFRIGANRFVGALVEDRLLAMVCVNLLDRVPKTVQDLGESDTYDTAVFYTIWSYAPGTAGQLLRETVAAIREKFPSVTRFVTLSPKTDMARRFHLRNGAVVFSDNEESINYEYLI